jgi:hypothetical protein
LPSASGGGGAQIGNPTQDAVVLGPAVAWGAAVALGAARVVVTAGGGVVELAVAGSGPDGEDDEHAARPKTAARITHAFTFATRTPSVTSKDRFTRYGGDGEFGPFLAGWLLEDHEPHGDVVADRRGRQFSEPHQCRHVRERAVLDAFGRAQQEVEFLDTLARPRRAVLLERRT